MKKIIAAENFIDFSENGSLQEPIYVIETEKTIFKANNLHEVFHLYRLSDDTSDVIDIYRVGYRSLSYWIRRRP